MNNSVNKVAQKDSAKVAPKKDSAKVAPKKDSAKVAPKKDSAKVVHKKDSANSASCADTSSVSSTSNKFDVLTRYQRKHTLKGSFPKVADFLLAANNAEFIRKLPGSSQIYIDGDENFIPESSDKEGLKKLGTACYCALRTMNPWYDNFGVRFFFNKEMKCVTMQMVNSDKPKTTAVHKPKSEKSKAEKSEKAVKKSKSEKPKAEKAEKAVKKSKSEKPKAEKTEKPVDKPDVIFLDSDFPVLESIDGAINEIVEKDTVDVDVDANVDANVDVVIDIDSVETEEPDIKEIDTIEVVNVNDVVNDAEKADNNSIVTTTVVENDVVVNDTDAEVKSENKSEWKVVRGKKRPAKEATKPPVNATEKKRPVKEATKHHIDKRPAKKVDNKPLVDTSNYSTIAIKVAEAELAKAKAELELLKLQLQSNHN